MFHYFFICIVVLFENLPSYFLMVTTPIIKE